MNQQHGNETKCFLVVKRSSHTFPMFVPKDDTDLALRFAIVGGTDNPAFELSLRAGNVPTHSQLPDGVKIQGKDGYLTAQFPILPTCNLDLKQQLPREVIKSLEVHLRERPSSFTPSLQDVVRRRATEDDYLASGLPEEAEELFLAKDFLMVSWKSSDPKTFGFERAPSIKATTNRAFAHRLIDAFRLIQLDAPDARQKLY